MRTVAPVAPVAAKLFTEMATTFAAISHDPAALEATIRESPSTIDVTTNSLKVQQPFLDNLNTLGQELTPATAELKSALPVINPAIEAGTKTLARTPALNANLQQVMDALKNLSLAPGTNMAVNALTSTVSTLNPMVKYLGPYQTVCNDWNYFWTYLSEHISEQTSFGFAQRALINLANPAQPNNVGQQGAVAPVNGGGTDSLADGRQRSSCTPRRTERRSTAPATPTARPASAATSRSSTSSTRRAATSRSTRTRPAIRARRSRGARASPRARRSAATRSPVPSSRNCRVTHETTQAPPGQRDQQLQGRPDRDRR